MTAAGQALKCGLLAGVLALPAPRVAAVDFHEGQWRFAIVTDVRGAQALQKPPPLRYEICFRKQSLMSLGAGGPCRMLVMTDTASELGWKLICDPRLGPITGRGLIKFDGDRMKGLITTSVAGPPAMELAQHISAKRLGECAKTGPGAPPAYQPLYPKPGTPPGETQMPAYRPPAP